MDRISIGKVLKPQGLKGELKIGCDNPSDCLDITRVFIMGRELEVESIRVGNRCFFVKLKGIDDLTQVEVYRNQNVFGLKSEIALDDGQYFIDDLIGAEVIDENNTFYGRITSIDNYGSKDVYTLEKEGVQYLFACVDNLIKSVDLDKKKVIVNATILKEVLL